MATQTQAPATPAPYASGSLYVGDLAPEVTEALLFEIFNAVGPVASVRVCRDAATRRSLGYAYVNFHRLEDAERALDTMNFTNIRGKACRIMWSHRDPSLRKSGQGNIFVKNLAPSIDNKTLYDTFSMFGNILSCKVAVSSKGSLGYGFVHYESEEAAQNAIAQVDGMVIAGQKVSVQPFKSKKERGGFDKTRFTNLYVKNLPEDMKQEVLDEMFTEFGKITSSYLAVAPDGKAKGFGFINYETAEEAAAAVEALNNKDMGEKKLYVARAQKKEEREKELRDRFERLKLERQKKYAGVNLYVKNLADTVDDDQLRTEFAQYGDITSAKVMKDAASKSKGFGFVCYATPEEATRAVADMNGKMMLGKPLYVALAQRKETRRAQLEAQYAARARQGAVPQAGPMGYPQGAMYYPGPGGMPQRVMYPQPQMGVPPRRWNPQQRGPGGQMMGHPGMNYGMMPMNGRPQQGQPRGRGRGGGQQGRQQRGQQQGGIKYNAQVRNREQGGQQMPQQQQGGAAAGGQQMAGAPQHVPLTIQALAAAPVEQQKQMIGERLFPLIHHQEPNLAGKITGMLLEMDNGELLHLLESVEARNEKIQEALQVLQAHQAQDGDDAAAPSTEVAV